MDEFGVCNQILNELLARWYFKYTSTKTQIVKSLQETLYVEVLRQLDIKTK